MKHSDRIWSRRRLQEILEKREPHLNQEKLISRRNTERKDGPALYKLIFEESPITSTSPGWEGTAGEVIQADLAQLGITVNINLATCPQCTSQQGTYSYNQGLNSTNSYNIEIPACFSWGPSELTPADAWVDFASNRSGVGNTAVYSNPVVETAINALFDSQNTTYIQSLMMQT